MKKLLIIAPLALLLTGCLSAKYSDPTGKNLKITSFLRKAEATDIAIDLSTGKAAIGSIKGQGDVDMIREIRGLMMDAAKLAAPVPVP